jgi:hypothetical protein
MVSSNGFTWNSSREDQNYRPSFGFSTGEILELTYDPIHKKMNLKNDLGLTISLNLNLDVPLWYACIILGSQGDSVEILSTNRSSIII